MHVKTLRNHVPFYIHTSIYRRISFKVEMNDVRLISGLFLILNTLRLFFFFCFSFFMYFKLTSLNTSNEKKEKLQAIKI